MAGAEVLGLLAELEHSLRTNPKEKITTEEENVLRNLKGSLVDTFLFSGVVSSLVTWRVARQFNFAPRLLYSAGAAFLGGSWACKWVLRSCLDPIIVADGSRMQKELSNIMLAKHQEENLRRSSVRKYLHRLFYPEQVFVDLHPDKSFIRWRPRNSYEDNSNIVPKEKVPVQEPAPGRPAIDLQCSSIREAKTSHQGMSDDPLECILGYPGATRDSRSSNSAAQARKIARANRRAHKRQRARNRLLAKEASARGI